MLIGEIFDEFISVIHENQKYVIGIINECEYPSDNP